MKIVNSINNENLSARKLSDIKLIVLHHTGSTASDEANRRFLNREDYISAHYLVGKDGTVYQLVDDDRIAYHAGISAWSTVEEKGNSVNWCSIGIEVNSDGNDFTDNQREAVFELCKTLIKKYSLNAQAVVRHKDIAPTRKWDIGDAFFIPYADFDSFKKKLTMSFAPTPDWSKVSPWARESVAKSFDAGIATNWESPQEIVGTATLGYILQNIGMITVVNHSGVTKEQLITALDKAGMLKK